MTSPRERLLQRAAEANFKPPTMGRSQPAPTRPAPTAQTTRAHSTSGAYRTYELTMTSGRIIHVPCANRTEATEVRNQLSLGVGNITLPEGITIKVAHVESFRALNEH